MNRLGRGLVRYGLALAALWLAWKWLAGQGTSGALPTPEAAVRAMGQAVVEAPFWRHMAASGRRVLLALGLAWGLAFPLGVLMAASRRLDNLLAPLVILTYPVPKIVLLPVLLLLLGIGDGAKVAMIALIVGYQILVAVRDAALAVHPKFIDAVRSLGAGTWRILWEVLLPAALPHGFSALRVSSGTAVAVLFFVESFATREGLGYLIMDAWGAFDAETMFVGIFGLSLLGVALFETAALLERRICRWQYCRRG